MKKNNYSSIGKSVSSDTSFRNVLVEQQTGIRTSENNYILPQLYRSSKTIPKVPFPEYLGHLTQETSLILEATYAPNQHHEY